MEEREPTRKELQDELNKVRLELAAAQAEKDKPNPVLQAELTRARDELAALRQPSGVAGSPKPYKGWVQATEDCTQPGTGAYRKGPKSGDPGEVFEVDLPALWSDDPFVPVLIKGYTEERHLPITEPNSAAPARIDFRFRPRVSVSTDITPLRAGSF